MGKHRLTSKVLSSKLLLEHILSYIPIQYLCTCSLINKNWHLIIKYIIPTPLINLKTLSMGELLYWLPGPNQFPKTVLLKLKFSSKIPKFIQISTSIQSPTPSNEHSVVGNSGHYQMLELSEILFIIDGHWTPIFATLSNETSFDVTTSNFFHRSKCFSIVTNTYMTYDFISFNSQTNACIVNTLRSIIHQTHEVSSKMAIFAKANKKYATSMNQTPLIFKTTLSALNFEMFVLILQDCINKIEAELDNIDIPSVITTQANPSLLYPMILKQNIAFSEWAAWIRVHLFESLKDFGYIKEIDQIIENSTSNEEEQQGKEVEILYDKKKHNRRQSSLFGMKAFPTDDTYDLFAGAIGSPSEDEDEEEEEKENKFAYVSDSMDSNDPNCLIM